MLPWSMPFNQLYDEFNFTIQSTVLIKINVNYPNFEINFTVNYNIFSFQQHNEQCPNYPVPCPNKNCLVVVKRCEVIIHVSIY